MRGENELLVLCAQVQLEEEAKQRIHELIKKGINWDYLLSSIKHHRVNKLVYLNLKKFYPGFLPATVAINLQRKFSYNLAHNLLLTKQLVEIVSQLEAIGVKVVPIKGPVFTATVLSLIIVIW